LPDDFSTAFNSPPYQERWQRLLALRAPVGAMRPIELNDEG